MNCKKVFSAALLVQQILFCWAQAVPHIDPSHKENVPTCNVNADAAEARLAARFRSGLRFAPPIGVTTYKLIVVRIDFGDLVMTKTKAQAEELFSRFKSFYLENSYDQLTVDYTVSNFVFRMPQTHAYYRNGINSKYSELVTDAVDGAVAQGIDFTTYDHIMIYHAGQGAETASNTSQYIWSVYVSGSNAGKAGTGTIQGKTFHGATFVPELEFSSVDPLGVTCHEYGHQQGLPDLYENTSQSAVGVWSLMDFGIYTGSPRGSNPSHMDAWSKQFLGFSAPQTISVAQGVSKTLAKANANRTAFFRLPIGSSDIGSSNEYFLLEYRSKSGATYDTALPGEGLLIWHVDDTIASGSTHLANNDVNANSSRRGLDLVESDITDPSVNSGDSGDPWTSGSFSAPKANAYNGTSSGVELSIISGATSSQMTFTLGNILNSSTDPGSGNATVTAGNHGYVNAKSNEKLAINVTPKTSGNFVMTIYTLTGVKIWQRTFSGTAEQRIAQEWDGKNDDGSVVASGIYILHINGAGVNTVKKIAVLNKSN